MPVDTAVPVTGHLIITHPIALSSANRLSGYECWQNASNETSAWIIVDPGCFQAI
jgi:hypothetical protein